MTDDGGKEADEGKEPDEGAEDELTVDDILAAASDDGQAADDAVAVLQDTVEERTRDLQRVTAEFQNYRKRVERDKARSGELATAAVLQSLLPVLDDMDRARDHGDLNGPFGAVAEQLVSALAKHGLESFGTKGDAFDPQIHEAVAHMQMPGVDGPTCIDVMRSGYRLGDKLLRPALVAVAEPTDDAEPAEAEAEPEATEVEVVDADSDDVLEEAEEPAEASAETAEAEAEPSGDDEAADEAADKTEARAEQKKDKGDKDS